MMELMVVRKSALYVHTHTKKEIQTFWKFFCCKEWVSNPLIISLPGPPHLIDTNAPDEKDQFENEK